MAVGKLSDVHSEEFILGQNIQKYRKKRGLSQTQLADIMDVDRAAISNYENGAKGEMGFKMLRRFSRALEVSTDALLGIYQVLPELIKLWGLNVRTDVEAKKTSPYRA